MKTEYQYIHFSELIPQGKTSKWSCRNLKSNEELGIVKWHSGWRQYCYFPTVEAVYSNGCLNDIVDFIRQLA